MWVVYNVGNSTEILEISIGNMLYSMEGLKLKAEQLVREKLGCSDFIVLGLYFQNPAEFF